MAFTIGAMARNAVNYSLAVGQSQAQSLGLSDDGTSSNALAINNLMGGGDDEGSGLLAGRGSLGASVITATSNALGRGKKTHSSGITPSLETQKTILGAGLGKGGILDSIG